MLVLAPSLFDQNKPRCVDRMALPRHSSKVVRQSMAGQELLDKARGLQDPESGGVVISRAILLFLSWE